MTRLQNSSLTVDCMPGDVVVVFYFSDQRPLDGPAALLDWRLDGQLTRILLDGRFKGKAGEHVLLQNNGKLKADRVLFVGGGKWQGLCAETHASLVQHALGVAGQAGFADVAICLQPHEEFDRESLQQQVKSALRQWENTITGCLLSCESITAPKSS